MKKRNSFAILTIAGAAVLSLASCEQAKPEPKPDPGHQHTYSELHAKVEPTCLSEGVEAYYSCTGCDLLFNENKEVISQPEAIPALPHTPHHHDATDPSCTEPGTGEYWTCDNAGDDKLYGDKDCKEVIQSIPVVDPKGHKLSHMDGNPASCKEVGWKEYYKCDDCDALFEDAQGKTSIADLEAWKKGAGKLDLAPHSAQFVAGQASTCKEHGWRDYYHCGGCDGYFEDEAATKPIADLAAWKVGAGKLELAAHTPVKQDGKEPTCTSDGWEDYYKCSVCDRLFEDEACESEITDLAAWKSNAGKLPMGEHGHKLVAGEASTCKEHGYADAYYCEGCEQYFEDAEAKTLIGDADAYEAWKVAGGQLPFAAHTPVKQDGKASSCTEHGWADYYKCSVCDRMFEEEACETEITNLDAWKVGDGQLPLEAHETSKINGQAATCEADGWNDYYQCSECEGLFEDEAGETPIADLAAWKIGDGKIPATGHDEDLTKTEAVAPTCYQTGVKEYYKCESCGKYFEDAAAVTEIPDLAAWKAGAGLIPATGDHDFDYSKTEVTWVGDMATAVAPCSTEGCVETISEEKQGSYVKDSDATCTSPELGHYEVTFDNTNFGSAQTDEGSVPHGDPHAHTYGDLVPQVDAHRETAGMKAYYKCSECNGYFDADKNAVSESSLVIPAPAKSVVGGEDENYIFSNPVPITEKIVIDFKFTDSNPDSRFYLQLMPEKEGGGADWTNVYGYFGIKRNSVEDNPTGVSIISCDDGYVRVTFDLPNITKISGTIPSGAKIKQIYFWGKNSNASGYYEVNSSVVAHTRGSELIPAKAAGPHGDDGYQAHYECTGCDDYWFNESGELYKKEDLIIASKAIKYAPPESGNTLAEFKNLGNITDKVSIDIHFDNPSKHQEVGFNFYESAWDNYYGTYWVDCDDSGVYFEGAYEGMTLDELTDGWWRVTAYPSALNNFTKDKPDIDQKRSIDFIYIKAPNTVSNRGSGMFELNSAFEGTVPSTKVYSFSGEKYAIDRTFLKGEIINLDVKIKNNTKINFALLTGWDTILTFNVKPDGTLEDQKNGVQIFKLNNELAGYPTLEGTWYRVIIDTNYIPAAAAFASINRIGGNKWNGAEYDMMINSPYTTDGWYTIAGGSSNTKIEFKIPTPLAIRDGDGQLLDKALYFEVKAVGTGKAYVSPMDYDWHNCGKYVLTFTDGALTDRVVQGSGPNKWPKVTDLGNGVYGLTIALSDLPGDGLANASSIGFFYNGDGVLADGLSEFSINVFSLKLVEIPA